MLSAVIFNALIIVALIPIALKGVHYKAWSAARLLKHNLLVYGLGGVIIPFAGIKLIDMVFHDGRVVGSSLIGQDWTKTPFFQTRPSAVDYDGASSGASNLGPTNPKLINDVQSRVKAWQTLRGDTTPVPGDLVTTSGSGLDPHISRAAALYQVPVVARRTGLSEAALTALIEEHDESGLFGRHHYVNVLNLNIGVQSLLRKAS